jgi:putative oxidoreductase
MATSGQVEWEAWAARYARLAVAAAFLSAVAGRFGLWSGHLNWDNFARFINRTAELNPFMPPATIPFLAWAATISETSLALALVAGIGLRWAAFGSALLLFWFGTAMALTAGLKSPLDYSVFSGSAAALLLAACVARTRPQVGVRCDRIRRRASVNGGRSRH